MGYYDSSGSWVEEGGSGTAGSIKPAAPTKPAAKKPAPKKPAPKKTPAKTGYTPYSGGMSPYGGSIVSPGGQRVDAYSGAGIAADIMARAKSMIGGRYVLGQSNPKARTFDCSGLTQWAYGGSGIKLPRRAADQANAVPRVNKNALIPGDMVFFSTARNGKVDHVGIYLGNGQYLHAASEGRGIKVDSINGNYFKTSALFGGRPVKGANTPPVAKAAQPIVNSNPASPAYNYSTDPNVKAMQDAWRAEAASAQKRLDEEIRQFNVSIGLEKDRFKQQQLMDERNYLLNQREQYQNMATTLLETSVSLQRPQDWLKYAQYTSGGKDIFQSLYGAGTAPTFGAAAGTSTPMGVNDLLAQLGINAGNLPQNAAATPSTAGQVPGLEELLQRMGALPAPTTPPAGAGGAPSISPPTPPPTVAPATTPLTYSVAKGDNLSRIAQRYGTTVQALAAANKIANPNIIQPGQRLIIPGKTTAVSPSTSAPVVPATTPSTGQAGQALIPQPHQINPAVWDSLSDTAKQMILGAAQAGATSSGYWEPADFLKQLEAARPGGKVGATSMDWAPTERY